MHLHTSVRFATPEEAQAFIEEATVKQRVVIRREGFADTIWQRPKGIKELAFTTAIRPGLPGMHYAVDITGTYESNEPPKTDHLLK